MAKNKTIILKDILLYLLPAAVFLLLVFIARMFIGWAFLIGAGIFTGLLFLFNPKTKSQAAKEIVDGQANQELNEIQKLIYEIRQIAKIIGSSESRKAVASEIITISDISESLVSKLDKGAGISLSSVSITKSYLQLMNNILFEYSEIISGKTTVKSIEEKQDLIKVVETKTIPDFRNAIENMAASLDKGDVSSLKIAIDTLSQLLKERGLIQ